MNIEIAKEMYKKGNTLEEIGNKYNISRRTVSRLFVKNNISIRTKSENAKINNSHWKNQKTITKDGYIKIWVNDKKVLEHRYIMEQFLGRSLEEWEIVHHINCDTSDNRIKNLKLVTLNTHRKEHIITNWSKKYDKCIKCGSSNRKHAGNGLCTKCKQYLYTVNKRGYECEYKDNKRIFSDSHKQKLSNAALNRYN